MQDINKDPDKFGKEEFRAELEKKLQEVTDPQAKIYLTMIKDVGTPWIEQLEKLMDKSDEERALFAEATTKLLAWLATGLVVRMYKDEAHPRMMGVLLDGMKEHIGPQLESLQRAKAIAAAMFKNAKAERGDQPLQ